MSDDTGEGAPSVDDMIAEAGGFAAMDQSSIDGLLGFASGPVDEDGSGLSRLYDLENVPQTRAPMLEAILERTVRTLESSLRKIASDQVEVVLGSIRTTRCKSYMESISLPAVLAIVRASPWGGTFLVVISANLVYGLVEVTLGGLIKNVGAAIEGRAFTSIETRVARRLLDVVIADSQEAFSTVSPVSFALDHLEPIPRFINIASPSSLAVAISVSIQIGDLATTLEILIPHSTLEPIQNLLTQTATNEHRTDASWSGHLRDEVLRSDATLTAVLHEEKFPLSRIMNLAIGDTLVFERGPEDPIQLRCDGIPVGLAKVGRSGKRAAVKVIAARPAAARQSQDGGVG